MLGFPTCLWMSHSPWVLEEEAKTDPWVCQTAKNQDVKAVPIPTSDVACLLEQREQSTEFTPEHPHALRTWPLTWGPPSSPGAQGATLSYPEVCQVPWGPNTPWRELRMSAELGQKTSHLYFYYPLAESQHLSSPHATGAVTFPTTFSPTEIISMFMSQYACCKYYISIYHLCSQPLWNCSRFWTCHRTCYLVHYGGKVLLYHTIFLKYILIFAFQYKLFPWQS